ncbi:hypothetical protein VTO73DRAFT_588 [Trametes versicolor]
MLSRVSPGSGVFSVTITSISGPTTPPICIHSYLLPSIYSALFSHLIFRCPHPTPLVYRFVLHVVTRTKAHSFSDDSLS